MSRAKRQYKKENILYCSNCNFYYDDYLSTYLLFSKERIKSKFIKRIPNPWFDLDFNPEDKTQSKYLLMLCDDKSQIIINGLDLRFKITNEFAIFTN
jgi:hypothetical protein